MVKIPDSLFSPLFKEYPDLWGPIEVEGEDIYQVPGPIEVGREEDNIVTQTGDNIVGTDVQQRRGKTDEPTTMVDLRNIQIGLCDNLLMYVVGAWDLKKTAFILPCNEYRHLESNFLSSSYLRVSSTY
ncbi:hypothetical protein GQX74_010571 [Glossina fuscipes]|nr:hypothetical protein GQX74_010571 [Glossina fuscipes]